MMAISPDAPVAGVVEAVRWPTHTAGTTPMTLEALLARQIEMQALIAQLESAVATQSREAADSFARGLAQGRKAVTEEYADAHRQAVDGYHQAVDGMQQAIEQALVLRQQVRGEVEQEMIDLALLVSARVLKQEAVRDASWIPPLVEQLIQQQNESGPVVVRVHPQHAAALDSAPWGPHSRVTVEAAPALPLWGLEIEGLRWNLDAALSAQWKELADGLGRRPGETALAVGS